VAAAIEQDFKGVRRRLVEHLQQNGIRDLSVLHAIAETPRHLFVPTGVRHRAYEDSALPIGSSQTISQPSIHARYLELLKLTGEEKVLEIGTGSGYQTALLSRLAAQVFTIERIPALLDKAREIIQQIGLRNISFLLGDGTLGWRQYAPYDAILVGAGAPEVPHTYPGEARDRARSLRAVARQAQLERRMTAFPNRPFVSRQSSSAPQREARFVLLPPYVQGRATAKPVEPELPSIDEFLDESPPIEQFAPVAAIAPQRAAEWPSWGGEAAAASQAESGWAQDELQGFNWGGAAKLGALPPDPAADAWASTDWSEPKDSQRSRQSAAESLAQALDQIARRIRAGDLRVPGAETVRDDAAIAATLAALLGIKR
jgi:protein-L-isoaspartate(D-aspartate) O-methyltransferase